MTGLRVLVTSLTLVLSSAALPAVVAAEPGRAAVVERGAAERPTVEQARAYAERERRAPAELESFEGGQVVIAISTVGAIVLAAILLILLL
jgi:hypothetical protein